MSKIQLKYFTLIGIIGIVISVVSIFLWGTSETLLSLRLYYSKVFYLPASIVPVICYLVFFTGYSFQKNIPSTLKWPSIASLLLCSLQLLFFFFEWMNILVGVVILSKWIPFCLGVFLSKNISKYFRWLSASIIITSLLHVIAAVLNIYSLFDIIWLAVNVILLFYLVFMFVIQHKNSKKVEVDENVVQ